MRLALFLLAEKRNRSKHNAVRGAVISKRKGWCTNSEGSLRQDLRQGRAFFAKVKFIVFLARARRRAISYVRAHTLAYRQVCRSGWLLYLKS